MKRNRKNFLEFLKEQGMPVKFPILMQKFGISKAARAPFKAFVDELVDDGIVIRLKGNAYALAPETDVVRGHLSVHREGYGFVVTEEGQEDIFVPARYLRENMHGDIVEARLIESRRSDRREGRIVRTIKRAVTTVVGKFQVRGTYAVVVPEDRRITHDIYIPAKVYNRAQDGQVVVAEVVAFPSESRPAEGRVSEILGWPEDPEVEVLAIVRKYGLPYQFSPEVLKEAKLVAPQVREEDVVGRKDLRNSVVVTIDGETARDFDDAVSIVREGAGYRLFVSIADVSHYVTPGSHLDEEAYERGTSVYFPDRAIPMLPEALSNGICSLNEGVDRLTMTAEMTFDAAGHRTGSAFYPSVIRSCARLTYTIVRKILADGDREAREQYANLVPHLEIMEELAQKLTKRRSDRGSIDFDLPEPQVVLDLQGQTEAIIRAERNLAHKLIEEFMLAANEAVASFIENKKIPSLYRVHEPPDLSKLRDFSEFIYNFGYVFRVGEEDVDPRELQKLLAAAAGKPEERLVNEVLLRSMKQARYDEENIGHFGLGADSYTHFTSPIRRYPDLVVHRILKEILQKCVSEERKEELAAALPPVADQTSKRERVAMEAEREIIELKKVQFMLDRIGEEFDGFITGVASFGIFVELVELFVEGMIHISMLPQDFYAYIEKQHSLIGERTGTVYRIGDPLRVRIASVSMERRRIDFVVAVPGGEVPAVAPAAADDYFRRVPVAGKKVPKTPKARGKKPSQPEPSGRGRGRGRKR